MRTAARDPFIAMAEITDEEENARTSSQVSDLSLNGCYVELINPFPHGTNVLIDIYTETESLEARATVARFEPKQGMGLTFDEISPHFASVLSKWLRQAKGRKAN
jgi:hypothetical protein